MFLQVSTFGQPTLYIRSSPNNQLPFLAEVKSVEYIVANRKPLHILYYSRMSSI